MNIVTKYFDNEGISECIMTMLTSEDILRKDWA